MEGLLTQAIPVLIASVLVEAIIFVVFSIDGMKAFDDKIKWLPLQVLASIILGVAVCYYVKLDIFSVFYSNVIPRGFGFVCTGLIVSRGSNFVHDIIRKIQTRG